MKILLVHNDYGKPSGEEAVVDRMAAMLRARGHEVAFYRLTSAGRRDSLWGRVEGFACGLYSPAGVRGLRRALRRERPDVVNVHNLYPFISPAALFQCRRAGVPVVMTVHNFRLLCPTGLFMRGGRPCELCLARGNEWPCVCHNCEHALLKSVGYAARNAVARLTGAYRKSVTAYACITDFQRRRLLSGGFDAGRLFVIPNSMDAPAAFVPTVGGYVAYVGRLSEEKGYDLLVDVARCHPEIEFRLAGALRDGCEENVPRNVRLLGHLSKDDLGAFLRDACLVALPSRCYEGFPMTILEAAAYGKPVVGPDHGGFTEIIGHGDDAIGRLFRPGDVSDLEEKIIELWNDPASTMRLGQKAFEKLRVKYSTEVVYRQWSDLFCKVVSAKHHNILA